MSNGKWVKEFIPEAVNDLQKLDGSVKKIALKAIDKVSTNPLPAAEGGYGKPLGNKGGRNLTGLLKVKLKQSGIRIVYTLVRDEEKMKVIVIGIRADSEVYDEAAKRMRK
ncbi:MAG: type II toxin-antitoxin system RelE/ParE family toxin [Eubacterium sp.]|nr:type II toxin-antitoxin system RelE/ParE family toxin [Candidatus Colimonas fimequi]